jgi:hypothetical protein
MADACERLCDAQVVSGATRAACVACTLDHPPQLAGLTCGSFVPQGTDGYGQAEAPSFTVVFDGEKCGDACTP